MALTGQKTTGAGCMNYFPIPILTETKLFHKRRRYREYVQRCIR